MPTWHATRRVPVPGGPRGRPDRLREAGLVVHRTAGQLHLDLRQRRRRRRRHGPPAQARVGGRGADRLQCRGQPAVRAARDGPARNRPGTLRGRRRDAVTPRRGVCICARGAVRAARRDRLRLSSDRRKRADDGLRRRRAAGAKAMSRPAGWSCSAATAAWRGGIYLDLFPTLPRGPKLGPPRGDVQAGCGADRPVAAGPRRPGRRGGGPPQPGAPGAVAAGCKDRRASRLTGRGSRGRVLARGRSADRGCAGVSAVLVSISRPRSGRCRFVRANGRCRRAGHAGSRTCSVHRKGRLEALAPGAPAARALPGARPRGRRRGNKERPAGRALKRARVR